ncbi:Undecaprenyl phosphate N,N'-diacetylbacillosamine 1-phosphate transferase [bioreactor metagenome]|uniref:Undecaprenyl phosphate N,N'-diacetylbacillosamine 1-phosphate transferase n=1 Tax=bioreactor metagenome TaxID=1076179 RepID=A0A645EX97_9ZZZZ
MYKFRSMIPDADNLEGHLTAEQIEQYQKEIKLDNDPRITKVGKFIRKTSIDELPQLFSILKGDMSFVGPRPLVERELGYYGSQIESILSVKPGLTGYWQVNGRSDSTYQSGKRQALELYYVTHCSPWFDIKIILQTILVVLKGVGAK